MEDVDREIEKRDEVTQIMLSSATKSILITLKHTEKEGQIERYYQFENQVLHHPEIEGHESDGELIGVAVLHDEAYGDARYTIVRVTT